MLPLTTTCRRRLQASVSREFAKSYVKDVAAREFPLRGGWKVKVPHLNSHFSSTLNHDPTARISSRAWTD